ncbi:hypothetical protein GOODEAATRI_020408 [Goodea atripinnis]|uniref:Uncharacterized protein n=1 Tax=Goodea atripinnis TaxID=208336 RepID=A0ABV0P6G4_9TELE
MSRHGHTFGSKLHMHGPIHSKINMVDLCQSPNSSIGLHWNVDQQRHLGHFQCSISFIHHRIHMKCNIHDHGSMPNMLRQSTDNITLAPPNNKQVSAVFIRKIRFRLLFNASRQSSAQLHRRLFDSLLTLPPTGDAHN